MLVVDDEPLVLRSIVRSLERLHQVVGVTSGYEALQRVEHDVAFDVVVLDLNLVDMTGVDLFFAIGRLRPTLLPRVIFASGDPSGGAHAGFLSTRLNARLDKPFDTAQLRALVLEVAEGIR